MKMPWSLPTVGARDAYKKDDDSRRAAPWMELEVPLEVARDDVEDGRGGGSLSLSTRDGALSTRRVVRQSTGLVKHKRSERHKDAKKSSPLNGPKRGEPGVRLRGEGHWIARAFARIGSVDLLMRVCMTGCLLCVLVSILCHSNLSAIDESLIRAQIQSLPRNILASSLERLSRNKLNLPSEEAKMLQTMLDGLPKDFSSTSTRPVPYAYRRNTAPPSDYITLVTHLSPNELDHLPRMLERWGGPLSCAVHLPDVDSIRKLDRFVRRMGRGVVDRMSIHVLMNKGDEDGYPAAALRNLALFNVETEYFLSLESGQVTSVDAHDYLYNFFLYSDEKARYSTLHVLPSFEVTGRETKPGQEAGDAGQSQTSLAAKNASSNDADVPRNKKELLSILQTNEDKVRAPYKYKAKGRATLYDRWLAHRDSGLSYGIQYEYGFTPVVVGSTRSIPYFEEGTEWNKVWTKECHLRGMSFTTLCDVFVIHVKESNEGQKELEETSEENQAKLVTWYERTYWPSRHVDYQPPRMIMGDEGIDDKDESKELVEYKKLKQMYEECEAKQIALTNGRDSNNLAPCFEVANSFIESSILWSLVGGEAEGSEGVLDENEQLAVLVEAETRADHFEWKLSEQNGGEDFQNLVADLYTNLGVVQKRRGAIAQAETYFNKAMAINLEEEENKELRTLLEHLPGRSNETSGVDDKEPTTSLPTPKDFLPAVSEGHKTYTSGRMCDAPAALSAYFIKEGNYTKYSKHNPVCPDHAYNRMHIAVPFYNLEEATLKHALESITRQQYPKDRVHVWVFDDASDLPESRTMLSTACGGKGHTFEFPVPARGRDQSWANAKEALDKMGLAKGKPLPRLTCLRSNAHLGAGGGKYWLMGVINTVAGPNDVVLILDGDDTLNSQQALEIINQQYIDKAAWFTYGSYEGKWGEQIVDLAPDLRNMTREFKPRQDVWVFGHPRTFKTHLLNHIIADDFRHSDGTWLVKGTDRGLLYRLLELSGPNRIAYVPQKIYKYNWNEKSSTLASVTKEVRNAQISHTMKGMHPSNKLELDLHVVLLVWKRANLLLHQLLWLRAQGGLGGRRIHVHLVNNNVEEERALEETVRSFLTFEEQETTPMKISVTHNRGRLHHNFARFVYVEQLRQRVPMDEVIFLDDDQYWQKDFLASLLKEHRPKGMTTWYGKVFQEQEGTGLADYWKSIITWTDTYYCYLFPEVSSYKYGGTGGSIFDTNLWLLDGQLMRLSQDLDKWSKVDDLWASYVLDALLGWEIRRLSPPKMPIDIGVYGSKMPYHNAMAARVKNHDLEVLEKLRNEQSEEIMKVSTFSDLKTDSVDVKQAMFSSLQTEFAWDAVNA